MDKAFKVRIYCTWTWFLSHFGTTHKSLPARFSYLLVISAMFFSITGCVSNAYYQSPFHTIGTPYRTMPMKIDSLSNSLYLSGSWSVGSANDVFNDAFHSGQFSIHRTNSFGRFSAYYGLNANLGSYEVRPYNGSYDFDTTFINSNGGKKFFGGAGAIGGISFVVPFNEYGEMRLGVESVIQQEFGEYLQFRQDMPHGSANVVNRQSTQGFMGIGLDIIGRSPGSGNSYGWKQSRNFSLNRQTYFPQTTIHSRHFRSAYYSSTFHFTRKRVTGYTQLNLGSEAISFLAGINYKLK